MDDAADPCANPDSIADGACTGGGVVAAAVNAARAYFVVNGAYADCDGGSGDAVRAAAGYHVVEVARNYWVPDLADSHHAMQLWRDDSAVAYSPVPYCCLVAMLLSSGSPRNCRQLDSS